MMKLADIRASHPEFDGVDDFKLTKALHAKFQHDTGRQDVDHAAFAKQLGYDVPGRLDTIGGKFTEGFTGTIGDMVKTVGIKEEEASGKISPLFDMIDAGEAIPEDTPDTFRQYADMYQNASPEVRQRLRERYTMMDPRENPTYQYGERVRQAGADLVEENPDMAEEFWSGKVPEAVGTSMGFVGSAALGPGGPAFMGMSMQAVQGFEEALDSGKTFEEAMDIGNKMAPIGATEALPIMRALDRADKATGGRIKRSVMNALKTGTEEGIQETVQSILNNMAAKGLYDPDRDTFEGTGEGAQIGGASGLILGFVTGMLGGKRGGRNTIGEDETQPASQDADQDVINSEEYRSDVVDSVYGEESELNQRAYHGTPHKVDKFSSEKINTGEGAQAYGHGLYFAEEKGVADSYRMSDNPFAVGWGESYLDGNRLVDESMRDMAENEENPLIKNLMMGDGGIAIVSGNKDDASRALDDDYDRWSEILTGSEIDTLDQRYKEAQEFIEKIEWKPFDLQERGNLYEVDLAIENKTLLDWDAPLSEQPEKVQKTAAEMLTLITGMQPSHENFPSTVEMIKDQLSDKTGGELVKDMERTYGQSKTSAILKGRGIPGIKYRDGNSRFDLESDGTNNYVIFDESLVTIKNENGQDITPDVINSEAVNMQPGSAYQGDIDTREGLMPEENVSNQKEPLVRQEIIRKYIKKLGIPIVTGNMGKRDKGVLGYYRPGQGTLRLRKHGDLGTAAHEIAHMLDDKLWNRFNKREGPNRAPYMQGNHPKWREFKQELKSVSYDEALDYEGFAEFVRLWMTQPEYVRQVAPQFTEYFEDFVAKDKKYGPIIREAQQDFFAWTQQGALNRARSKMGKTPSLTDGILTNHMDDTRQSVFDQFHGVLKMERSLKGQPQEGGAYEAMRLSKSAMSQVDAALRFGRPVVTKLPNNEFEVTYEGRGLKDILDSVDNVNQFLEYAVGRSARELKQQGRENLFSNDEIDAMLRQKRDGYDEAFNEYQRWNESIVDFAQALGYITPEQRSRWNRNEYIPFYRVTGSNRAVSKKGIEKSGDAVKMLTGGTDNLNDIVQNMIQNASNLMVQSINNHARMKVVDMAQSTNDGGMWVERVPAGSQKVSIGKDQIKAKLLESMGIDPKLYAAVSKGNTGNIPKDIVKGLRKVMRIIDGAMANMENYVDLWQMNQQPNQQNMVGIIRNGKTEYYRIIDPLLYRSFQGLNPRHLGPWMRGFSGVRGIGQTGVTMTPDFMIANIFRDTVLAGLLSKNGLIPFYDSFRGMYHMMRKSPLAKEFIANGGGMATYLVDEAAMKRQLDNFYVGNKINPKYVVNTPMRWYNALERFVEAFEVGTRLGEYDRALKRGKSKRAAALEGREISTDFAMRGDNVYVNGAYDTVMFLKAAMNGMDRVYRGFVHDPNKHAIWAKTAALASASAYLALMNMDDERYEQLPDWDKWGHWHVFIGDDHFRFPKIWEVGALTSLAERSMEAFLRNEFGDSEYYDDMRQIIMNQLKLEYIPQVVKPIAEAYYFNENRFTGAPIENISDEGVLPYKRYNNYTSDVARDIGEATGWSPKKIDHLIKGYFSTWGMYGLMITNDADRREAKDPWDYPVLRRFMGNPNSSRTKQAEDFYDMLNEWRQVSKTMQEEMKDARPEKAEKLMEKNALLLMQGQPTEMVYDAARELTKQKELIRESDLHPVDKRNQINAIDRELRAMYLEWSKITDQMEEEFENANK